MQATKPKLYLTSFSELMAEWDWEKNSELGLDPSQLTHGCKTYAYWKCANGHSWPAKIANRTILHRGCPECWSNIRGLKKSTPPIGKSLKDLNPDIAAEWDFEKNGSLLPEMVYPNARKTVFWRCTNGHEWSAPIYSRSAGTGCKQCQKAAQSSFPEKALFFYISKHFEDAQENFKSPLLKKWELDIYIPSLNTGIEYDGGKWHQNLENDIRKNKVCEENGIRLFRVRDPECPLDCNSYEFVEYIHLNSSSRLELEKTIISLLQLLGKSDIAVNIETDSPLILKLLNKQISSKSILHKAPHLLSEWDYNKNGDISPENFTYGTPGKFYWICAHGHSYQSTVAYRMRGNGCSVCASKTVLAGINDLESQYPQLAKEWHPDNKLLPSQVFAHAHDKFLWLCPNGHTYSADPNHRIQGTGCSVCASRTIVQGQNDLASVRPELAKEWHPTKNLPLTPSNVSKSSGKKVWWLCPKCGHEWPAGVNKRAAGRRCPNCYAMSRKKR